MEGTTEGCTDGCGGYFGVRQGSEPVNFDTKSETPPDPELPSWEGFEQLETARMSTSPAP